MSRLSEQHMLKTKSAKLLSVPTRVCSTIESPAQYQLSHATVHQKKHANHPQQSYHTRGRSPHIVHVVIEVGDE